MISLSVVVPVYSGEAYLSVLLDEIGAVRKDLECRGMPLRLDEVIFVDDGAIDGSAAIIDKLADSFGYVTALHLSRNFGQHPATIAGILHTSGDWVVTLDEDMQHPPSRIIDLFEVVVKSGADVVYGRPKSNVHQSVTRDFSSRKFKAIIERLTGNKHISKANSFRLVRGSVARAASSVCGHDTYFDIALSWFTQRIESRQMVLKDTRFIETGKSGYTFKKLLSHAIRLTFSSQVKLLRGGALLGIAVLALTSVAAIILIVLRLFTPSVITAPGWTSIMMTICFFSGLTLFLIGVLLEYVSILVLRAHGKPLYFTVDRRSDHMLENLAGNTS